MEGTVLKNTYRIVKPLGSGGMGTVYVAEHMKLPRKFAIKFVNEVQQAAPEILKRFEREAAIASGLGHPNIVDVVDFDFQPDGAPFIVMELLDGEDLAARISRRGAIPVSEMRSLSRELFAALAVAHKADVVHRDLKPQNIFLHKCGGVEQVKVLDFGISKIRHGETNLTADQAIMGTAHYMAPEQARGAAGVDARADLFSLGAILHECLSGKLAFGGKTLPEVVHAICYGPRPSIRKERPDLSQAVEDVIVRLTAVEPDGRFVTAAEAWTALAPALGTEATSLSSTSRANQEVDAEASTIAGTTCEAVNVDAATVASDPGTVRFPTSKTSGTEAIPPTLKEPAHLDPVSSPRDKAPFSRRLGILLLAVVGVALTVIGSLSVYVWRRNPTTSRPVSSKQSTTKPKAPSASIPESKRSVAAQPLADGMQDGTNRSAKSAASISTPSPDYSKLEGEAIKLHKKAIAAFNDGNYVKARKMWRQASVLSREPKYLYNLGRMGQEMGKSAFALEYFRQFVDNAQGKTRYGKLLIKARLHLKSLRRQVAVLEIIVPQPGARVFVDSRKLDAGPTRATLYLLPGEQIISASLPGHYFSPLQLILKGGAQRRVVVRLSKFAQ